MAPQFLVRLAAQYITVIVHDPAASRARLPEVPAARQKVPGKGNALLAGVALGRVHAFEEEVYDAKDGRYAVLARQK